MPHFTLESHGLQVLLQFIFALRWTGFVLFCKYVLDTEDSKSASIMNLYSYSQFIFFGRFVAVLNSEY